VMYASPPRIISIIIVREKTSASLIYILKLEHAFSAPLNPLLKYVFFFRHFTRAWLSIQSSRQQMSTTPLR
jgi:hypothetical protein